MSDSTPAAGAGTSIVTLSVSSSTSGSSTATGSPGFLNHLPMVASVTDSPSVGTRISAMTSLRSLLVMPGLCRASTPSLPSTKQDVDGRDKPGHDSGNILAQRLVEELLQLRKMARHHADRGRGRRRTARVARLPIFRADLVQHPLQEGVDEE